ncbi:hypothetical protein OK016_25740 [Vibrio chagasii]|nr:hypothetical protein [Vibrio chagasii]
MLTAMQNPPEQLSAQAQNLIIPPAKDKTTYLRVALLQAKTKRTQRGTM